MNETQLRDAIHAHGRLLFGRGFCVGTAGSVAARLPDGFLVTPAGACLGRLDPARISRLDAAWQPLSGDAPSREVALLRAVLEARPEAGAALLLPSTHATAIACLATPGEMAPIPAFTPTFAERVGRAVPVLPYLRPGDPAPEAVAAAARAHRAMLLANRGPVVSGASLDDAVFAAEELEEAARLALLLRGAGARALTEGQVDDLGLAEG